MTRGVCVLIFDQQQKSFCIVLRERFQCGSRHLGSTRLLCRIAIDLEIHVVVGEETKQSRTARSPEFSAVARDLPTSRAECGNHIFAVLTLASGRSCRQKIIGPAAEQYVRFERLVLIDKVLRFGARFSMDAERRRCGVIHRRRRDQAYALAAGFGDFHCSGKRLAIGCHGDGAVYNFNAG